MGTGPETGLGRGLDAINEYTTPSGVIRRLVIGISEEKAVDTSEFGDLPVGFARPNYVPFSQAERHVIDLVAYEEGRDKGQAAPSTEPHL